MMIIMIMMIIIITSCQYYVYAEYIPTREINRA